MASSGKDTVVLFPSPGLGHLIPLVELGRRFLSQGLSVAIITLEPIFSAAAYSDYVTHTSAAIPSISFHRLPPVTVPPISSRNTEAVNFALLHLSIPNLLPILTTISSSSTISSLILDFFCTDALDLAAELNLRTYFYFTCSGNALAAFIQLPVYGRRTTTSFKDLGDTLIHFPGIPPLPATHMPLPVQDREDEAYRNLLYHFDRLIQADGIIVNTVRSIESRAIKAVEDGLCSDPGRPVPPIYCIGPVVSEGRGDEQGNDRCISWLDSQPRNSVIFLCFGSMVMFTAEQLKQIGTGLERSGHRFLWTVRNPPGENSAEPDLEKLLPPGFEDRTRDRGMVVKSWAPQAAVLRHEAVGGFVTHCGWNSVLEAVCTGVPMIAWPLYAEQRMNKVFLVQELKLAKEMKGYEKSTVSADDVEATIRWLMESEEGKELKERAAEARQRALAALSDGGASHKELMELVNQWKPAASQSPSEVNGFVKPTPYSTLLV